MWSERIYLSSLQTGGHIAINSVCTYFPLQLRGAILLGSSDMQGNSSSGSNTATGVYQCQSGCWSQDQQRQLLWFAMGMK